MNETRYRVLGQAHPAEAEAFMKEAHAQVTAHWQRVEAMAKG